jgi:predicted secreted protein
MANSPPEGQASSALLGYGSFFRVGNSGSSPTDYMYLSEVSNITPPSLTVDQVDVTHMQSPGRIREFISGLIDPGETSFEMNFIPGSETDQILFDWMNTPVTESRRRSCQIIFSNGMSWTFNGEITGYEPEAPVDDKMTATVTIKVTGLITTNY